MHSLKWIWTYMRDFKSGICIGFLLVLVVAGLNMLNPYFSGRIVDDVIYGGNMPLLWKLIGFMIAVTMIKTVIRYSFQLLFERISQRVIYTIRKQLYERLNELDFRYYDRTKTGDIMARMTGDMEAVRHFTAWTTYMIVENAMVLFFAIIFMFTIHAPLTVAMLAVTPVIGFFAYRMSSEVRPTFSEIRAQFARLNSVVQENISGNRVVKAFAKEEHEIGKFSAENRAFKEKNIKSARVWEKYLPVLDSLAGVLTVVMILAGGFMVVQGSLTIGELVIFNSLIWALNNPMRMAGWLINDVQRFIASAEKIEDLLNEQPAITNRKQKGESVSADFSVQFQDVTFKYEDEPVLSDITFGVKTGQTVAIVGPTGAGKSTIVNLLCRFYDADSGEVIVEGRDVKDWNVRSLRKHTAMVMQDIFLFSDTIEGNIAYGMPDATLEQVKDAAKKAEAHGFISKLPEGYDTIIGERGVGLSGGQRQRISLARALLKDAPILILDDTTSAVDLETEMRIQKTLKPILREKTCFIIAHRISSVKEADLILVLENGQIMERGRHEDLLKRKGRYYNVFKNQFGDFDGHQFGKEVM
ncbi:ABC transporter ATP-binding protein [Domibacillus indicus]|uniref:ABC transporter ATP-binding protein n=1 Tax=Domibacillus indicus TaxID=1437523 RepID=UPI000617D58C|nr:ABC transporter ATP-binding protein [Domibacillus indicus]